MRRKMFASLTIVFLSTITLIGNASNYSTEQLTFTQATDSSFAYSTPKTTLVAFNRNNPIHATTLQQSGCCSWHHGACGCGSTVICCDGSASPTCGC